ncbi:translation initiation factor IF-3 [uncultured Roseibium sp.]|uniref:translation initiation factor IF-3 n=1 Tax=uncultured Roseibium sp. TaxID=1936171 RepID=UPI002614023C|nr:translation initiation factor IF-3 [uncultured Roseibium sp.]
MLHFKEGQVLDGGKLLFQLLRIVCGFVLAVIACGLFLAWGFFRAAHPDQDPVAFAAMAGSGLVGASVIGGTVLVPAAVLIAVAEAVRLQGFIFHVAAAGAIAFLVWTLGAGSGTTDWRPGSAVVLAAGFLAGAVYWLIAGRMSGGWHGVKDPAGKGRNRNA